MRLLAGRSQVRMVVEDPSHVGECRRETQRLAAGHDFDETLVGRIGIVATEMTRNLIKHAGHGELLVQAIQDGDNVVIELIAVDRGPGMQVERCMHDGYSTAGTAGTGLGAMLRLSSVFDVYSVPGQGTVAAARFSKAAAKNRELEFGSVSLALAGEIECGDIWSIAVRDGFMTILVVDGLGHGPLAANASRAAATAFGVRPFDAPSECMHNLHRALAGGRGAAAACAVIDATRSKVTYSGIGNISGSVVAPECSRGMVSNNGILGVRAPRHQQFEYDYAAGHRIVMHSDGISSRWSLSAYPGLYARHPLVIAAVLYRDHARTRDDATIVVVSGVQR